MVLIARLDVDSVSFATLPNTVIEGNVQVGTVPSHVTFNPSGTFAYVTNQGNNSVSVINTELRTSVATIPTSSDAWNVIVSPDGARLYVTTDQGTVYAVATNTHSKVDSLVLSEGDALRGVAFQPDGSRLYVAGRNTGRVYVLETPALTVIDTMILGGTLQRMAVSQAGDELYVANESRGLDIVTLSTGAVVTVPLAAGAYGLALSPDGEQLYVTVPEASSVQVVDRVTRAVVNTLYLGGHTRNVAFSATGAFAVVTAELPGAVHFIR
jgi:YVTN family beta-propeller protein